MHGEEGRGAFDGKATVGREELTRPKMLPVGRVKGNHRMKEAVLENRSDKRGGTNLCLSCYDLEIFLQVTNFPRKSM